MIVVKNTKELEEKYDLEKLKDDEKIMVQGGLNGKNKYNSDHYISRVTYDAKTLKLIIQQMKMIESQIPKEWNELQKAKYIYTVLAQNIEYERDESKYETGNCSNLMGLMTGKSICAGYSLIFKEMMDRQGIQCDYMRGIIPRGDHIEKHAWNTLIIQGNALPIDLTWDSNRLNRGEKGLSYFGTDPRFFEYHITDRDEKNYKYFTIREEDVEAIDISEKKQKSASNFQIQPNEDMQQEYEMFPKDAINYAIEKTYKKLLRSHDKDDAREIVMSGVRNYLTEGRQLGFTREGNARSAIVRNATPGETLEVLAENYVKRCMQKERHNTMENAIMATAQKYSTVNASKALVKYVKTGITSGFTRDGNARRDMMYHMNNYIALDTIIEDYVNEQIRQIQNLDKKQQRHFSVDEFSELPLPENKKESIIKSALAWIKGKTREIFNTKKEEQNKNIKREENKRQEGR